MRSVLIAHVIIFISFVCLSEDKPHDWHTPESYESKTEIAGFGYYDEQGEWHEQTLNLGKDGTIEIDWDSWDALSGEQKIAYAALREAVKAQIQVKTLDDNIYKLLAINGIKVPTGDGHYATVKLQTDEKGQLKLVGGQPQIDEDGSSGFFKPDGLTIERKANSESSGNEIWQLYGKPENAADGEGKFPMFGGSTLLWVGLKSYFDDKSIEAETASNYRIRDGGIRIKGWDKDGEGTTLATTLKSSENTTQAGYQVLARTAKDGATKFIPIGYGLGGGSVKVDGASIVTNETEDGSASIAGFHEDAANGSVPFANGETLNWTGMPTAGSILGADENATPRWTSTQSGNYYYGTPKNGDYLGWHELPNVTTNAVEVDDATLKSNADEYDPSIKRLSLYNAPGSDGRLYGAFMAEGKLGWAAVAESTNTQYGVDAVSIDTNGLGGVLQIVGWKDHSSGFVMHGDGNNVAHKTVLADEDLGGLEFEENDTDFGFNLENWWDGYGDTCSENLGGILTGEITEDENSHLVLTRKSDGTMHYMKVGRVPSAEVDGVTITTNYNDGAVIGGKASIYGFRSAAINSLLYKNGNNAGWIAPPQGASTAAPKVLTFNGSTVAWGDAMQTIRFTGTDGKSVDVGSGGAVHEVTFASATDSNVQVSCKTNSSGGATITIGVYWFTGSNE